MNNILEATNILKILLAINPYYLKSVWHLKDYTHNTKLDSNLPKILLAIKPKSIKYCDICIFYILEYSKIERSL